MTSRSIVLGTAAVLLMSAATPLQIGFTPTAAHAQQLTLDAAMAGNPSDFSAQQLRERIQVLRDAIQSGALQGENRKAAQQKMKAYREVLQGIRAERQEAKQDDADAEQPKQGERTQRQVSEPQAEQPAQKEERKAERQAQKDERQAQRDERQAEKAEREAQREAERQAQRQAERQAQRKAEQQAEQAEQQAEQAEQQAEQAERQAERKAERQAQRAERQDERQEARQTQRQPEPEEVNRRAREIISDNRSASDLDNQALRQRLDQNREILGTDQLSREQSQALRQQLRADREELRARVASRQEEQEEQQEARAPARGSDNQTRGSRDRSRGSDDRMDDRNVLRIIEERTPSDQLTERELELRVRVLSRALNAGNITVRQAEVARLLVDRDRDELRRRLHADRDRRHDRRRSGSRDYVLMEFEVGYRPPPVIYAAEAMPREIQMQLIAPPMYQTQRAYTVHEIATNHDVREMMPGIEIDTLNFDFGSAQVRPEEIDKLDEIGMVIESIVAERPNEVFLIEGHTDAVGSHEANDALSQRRAQAVVDALLDYFIIDPENLQTVGLGKRYLKIQTPEAEEENRRVTVRRITPLLAGRG